MESPQPGAASGLEPDRLPDPGNGAVALFPAQRVSGIDVPRPDDEVVAFVRTPVRREIELERSVAAFVAPQPDAIQPGIALPVDGSEHDEWPPPLPVGRCDQLSRVPARALELLAHPGQRRRPRKRHPDAPLERSPAGQIPAFLPAAL